jgi:hypothetical protein
MKQMDHTDSSETGATQFWMACLKEAELQAPAEKQSMMSEPSADYHKTDAEDPHLAAASVWQQQDSGPA